MVSDARNTREGGSTYQWQILQPQERSDVVAQDGAQGLNKDGMLKQEYAQSKWVLVPLEHWNLEWNSVSANQTSPMSKGYWLDCSCPPLSIG